MNNYDMTKGEVVATHVNPSMPINSMLKRPTPDRVELIAARDTLRSEVILRIKSGEFEELMPLLEAVQLSDREISDIVITWIKTNMPGKAKLYSEALTFRDYDAIRLQDAAKIKSR